MRSVLLLHLGPASSRQALMRAHGKSLAARGLRLVLADDYLEPEDRELFDTCLELPPPEQIGASLALLEPYASTHPLDGVLVQTEAALLTGSLLAARLGVRAPTPEAAHLCTNKLLCRVELERAGVPVPAFALGRDARDVRRFAREHAFPLVLKPIASTMGKGLELVESAARIEHAVERVLQVAHGSPHVKRLLEFARLMRAELGCAPERSFLIESFAPGDPVETDGLLLGRAPRTFGVTEQMLSAPPLFFVEGYLLPSDRPAGERARIQRISEAALAAVGLGDAGFSIELRADGGDARVIDLNGRLGEDDGFGRLFATATGCDPMLRAIELAAGLERELELESGPHCALAYQSTYADGVVTRVPGEAEVARAAREGIELHVIAWPGLVVHAPPHEGCFPHLAYALARDPRSSRAAFVRARAAVSELEFVIEPLAREPALSAW